MSGTLGVLPWFSPLNGGEVIAGGQLFCYDAGGTTKRAMYTTSALAVQHSNPLVADANGRFAAFWVDPSGGAYKLVLASSGDTDPPASPLRTEDNIPAVPAAAVPFYERTTAEISAGITPTNYQIPSHTATGTVIVDRYGTNTTPGTTSMQTALDSAKLVSQQSGCPIELLGETYLGTLSLRFDNAGVIGQGSRYTTLKNPAGALSTGGVIEVGDTASGNGAAAYVGFICRDLTIDGNKAAATAPADDVTGHGLILTNTTHWRITDVIAKNCHNAGVIPVIVSSYGHVECTVESCGNATHTGPGFDINSSSHITGSVISKDCYQGARVLDNCFGVNLKASVYNATNHGFIYNNQTVNFSYNNNLDVTVYTCGAIGLSIGPNCSSSNIRATVYDATSFGCQIGGNASFPSYGNHITLATYNGDVAGLYIDVGADDNEIHHTSVLDGRAGAQGTVFAVDVNGNRNKLTVSLRDSSTWQVRGIAVRAGATDNDIVSYSFTNTADPYNDAGTRTRLNGWLNGSATYDPASLADAEGATTTVTVSGAALGDFAAASFSLDLQGVSLTAYVSAADTVSVRFQNESGGVLDLGSGTLRASVRQATVG